MDMLPAKNVERERDYNSNTKISEWERDYKSKTKISEWIKCTLNRLECDYRVLFPQQPQLCLYLIQNLKAHFIMPTRHIWTRRLKLLVVVPMVQWCWHYTCTISNLTNIKSGTLFMFSFMFICFINLLNWRNDSTKFHQTWWITKDDHNKQFNFDEIKIGQ